MKRDWNYERHRTRDLLLEYNFNIVPPGPHSAGMPLIYPWESTNLSILSHQIYTLAQNSGYTGTENKLWDRFINGRVYFGTIGTFPVPGEEDTFYLDKETGILYYFKITTTINLEEAELVKAIVAGIEGNTYYLYIPVSAYLIEDTILNCGNSEVE